MRRQPSMTAVIIGVLVLVALVVGGTFLARFLGGHLAGLTVTPKAGNCWQTDFTDSQHSEDWEGTASVPCGSAHQSYTYAVAKLTKSFSYSSWLDSANQVRSDVDANAAAACLAKEKALLPGITATTGLLNPTYYLPSTSLWGAGARWVRCDVTEVKVGSSVASPQLADLPAFSSITSTLASDPKKFDLCEDDPQLNGPDGDKTTYADCTGSSDYTMLASLKLKGAPGADYPSAAKLTAAADALCATLNVPKGHDVIAEPPTKINWITYNDREVDCWRNNN